MSDSDIMGAAYQCLLEQKWHFLPIDPICYSADRCYILSFLKYAKMSGLALKDLTDNFSLTDGYTIHLRKDTVLILYNDQVTPVRQRFTVAHELGHLMLGHCEHAPCYEEEADIFASILLMPDILLRVLEQKGTRLTESLLTRRFGVSHAAARQKLAVYPGHTKHLLEGRIVSLFYAGLRSLHSQTPDFSNAHVPDWFE